MLRATVLCACATALGCSVVDGGETTYTELEIRSRGEIESVGARVCTCSPTTAWKWTVSRERR